MGGGRQEGGRQRAEGRARARPGPAPAATGRSPRPRTSHRKSFARAPPRGPLGRRVRVGAEIRRSSRGRRGPRLQAEGRRGRTPSADRAPGPNRPESKAWQRRAPEGGAAGGALPVVRIPGIASRSYFPLDILIEADALTGRPATGPAGVV